MTTNHYLNIENINRIMKERGISEKQLAEKIGISQMCLNGYLTQYREKVPFKIFVGLYYALDIPFNQLITTLP
ncbi:MAG: helix-turn-helix transcriptional regulator [Clostridia bacterium]|nr:helix-turn-helix transcriptional regulator [Clostridia bacterium]